jgi:hypothetical protein
MHVSGFQGKPFVLQSELDARNPIIPRDPYDTFMKENVSAYYEKP